MNLLSSPDIFLWCSGAVASVLCLVTLYFSTRGQKKDAQLLHQLEREKRCSDQLAHFVIPIGISLMAESDFATLLEKILQEGKSLSGADGGTLYLVTPEKKLCFAIVMNDSLKIAMGGKSGAPVSLPPLDLYDPVSGEPNRKNIATSCAHAAQALSVANVYAADAFDFSGTKAFDRQMNYRTISVLCVPLKDAEEDVIGVLQLINARDAETGGVVPFDEHVSSLVGLLGLLATAALKSYLRVKKLTDELADLRIKIDEGKKTRQVAEITESDYFKNLQAQAGEMRSKVKRQGRP